MNVPQSELQNMEKQANMSPIREHETDLNFSSIF